MKKIISLLLALVLTLSACSVALAADVVLRPGDKGDAVKEVQTLLTSYGYYSGKINGSYNTATTTAVRNFQRYNSLTVDGKVGPKTMAVLKSGNAVSAPLKPNETNNSASVKMVQTLLRDLGYYNGKIDGKYGKATIAAVKMFQKYNELPIDGKVGEDTLNRMKSSAAIKAPVNQKDSYSTENKHIQERLKYYGYYTGKIDGIYGSGTIAAVKAFQRANGLKVDGAVGPLTLAKLDSNNAVSKKDADQATDVGTRPILRPGDKEAAKIKHIQERLKYYGYYTGKIDGIYGSGTIAAVKAFQRANGLKVDGAVGPLTLAKLDSNNAVSKKDADQATDVGTRPILRPGDKEAAKIKYIKEVQTILKAKGLYTGEIDGVYSGIIVTAVRLFQQQNGLTIDGRVGANTWKVLLGGTVTPSVPVRPSVLRPGDKNAYVKELQQNLVTLGYSNVPVDGVYGAKTTAAVKALQRKHALDVDGKAGPKTLAKINELLNAASTPSDPDANG